MLLHLEQPDKLEKQYEKDASVDKSSLFVQLWASLIEFILWISD